MPKELPPEKESNNPIPKVVYGYVSVAAAKSFFADEPRKHRWRSARAYRASARNLGMVARDMEKSGFTVLSMSRLGIAMAAPPGAWEELTGARIVTCEKFQRVGVNESRYVTHLDLRGHRQPAELGVALAESKASKIDGIVLEQPRQFHAISSTPPAVAAFHMRLPGDLVRALGAQDAHTNGSQGNGVLVAMPDSGHFPHPYFAAQGYRLRPPIAMVTGTDPQVDPVGHGTGQSANLFALAPQCELLPIRVTDDDANAIALRAAFIRAKESGARVITNSWGGDQPLPPPSQMSIEQQVMASEIIDAIEQGIVVIFSAGNSQFSVEPQVPGVLAAGGVHFDQHSILTASDFCSAYRSPWFAGQSVPTVCGAVGLLPRAQTLMLPVPPGSDRDIGESRADSLHNPGDGTAANDGWARFSGSSAAAPQLAGAVAVLLGALPALTPPQVVTALRATAIDVTTGHCHPRFNEFAGVGEDVATGSGLINVSAALAFARANF